MSHLTFPGGFLLGSAGSAHQTEGNNRNSDWWSYELAPGTGASEPSGAACDSYHRYAEDWELIASSGQNAVRFSIEWARIEPAYGEFSTAELDHYREILGSAQSRRLTTFVTLHHFTNPMWFAEGGAWEDEDSPKLFARYAAEVAGALGDLLQFVNTLNEPQVVASLGYTLGVFPPRKADLSLGHRVTANLIKAHAAAAEEIKRSCGARVGLALSMNDYVPEDDSDEARQFTDFTRHSMTGVYLDAIATGRIGGLSVPGEEVRGLPGLDDFTGVQYYTKFPVGPGTLATGALPPAPEGERTTQMGWRWHPEGLGKVIDEAGASGLPVYVTENGIATDDDDERIEYVTQHLRQVGDAIGRGTDVRGYFYWSYLDNFEWNEGYRPKFGLIACDRETFERKPKPSLAWYGGLAP